MIIHLIPKCLGFFFYHKMKLQVHTNYKLHEMEKAKARLNRTQNLQKVTYRLTP